MKYLTPEEIKNSHQEEAHAILGKSKSQLNRFGFGIETVKACLEKSFHNDKNARILDLGTGSGTFARQLKEIGCTDVSGADIDDYRQEDAKPLYREFKKADLGWDKLPWPDNTFDIVTGWCVLPHLENPFHCAREVARILKRGGVFIFSVPHITSKPAMDYFVKNKNFGHYKGENNHIAIFTPPVMKKTILRNFESAVIEYPVRPKVFERGAKGKIRAFVYPLINKYFPVFGRALRSRWAYDAVYIARKAY